MFTKIFKYFFAMILLCSTISAMAEDRYLILFTQQDNIPANADQIISSAGGTMILSLKEVGMAVATSSDANFVNKLQSSGKVTNVALEPAYSLPAEKVTNLPNDKSTTMRSTGPTPADFLFPFQWNIRRVFADQVWSITSGSHNTVVAVIDTGVASNHPDLAPNLVYSNCFSTQPACSIYPNLSGHGTYTAGIVAGAFGNGAIVGVGPNLGIASYNVFELLPGNLLQAATSSIARAMIDSANHGFKVVNLSLGHLDTKKAGPKPDFQNNAFIGQFWNRLMNFMNKNDVVVIAAAGNDATNLNGPLYNNPSNLLGLVSVGATGIRPLPQFPQANEFDVLAFYSNFGASSIDLVAPGGDLGPNFPSNPDFFYEIVSSYVLTPFECSQLPVGFCPPIAPNCVATKSCPVTYVSAAGTSASAPEVSGAAGLMRDINPSLTHNQVKSILIKSAQDIGSQQQFGHGMLNVLAAVNAAK